jgi:hypothetical protein
MELQVTIMISNCSMNVSARIGRGRVAVVPVYMIISKSFILCDAMLVDVSFAIVLKHHDKAYFPEYCVVIEL